MSDNWQGNDDAQGHAISLSVEINIGLLAGSIAATFYAAQCTDDSPLFVATWYTIAIVTLAVIGAIGADLFAQW
ncbi:hypothetical protein J2W42_005829 [Rhizobium tibeticum]|nr:hypothetical protein [Rhizobium tibeticum]